MTSDKERIKELEDDKLNLMAKQISDIHECLFGNGKPGLKTIVAGNTFCLKILGWSIGVVYTAAISFIVVEIIKKLA